jgi:hypothetical protein
LLASLFSSFSLTGCESIYEDGGECPVEETTYAVRFRYDMNLKFADAFNAEVDAVTLLVLDQNNNLVWKGTEKGEALTNEDYEMTLPVKPGTYKLLAWCTTNEQNTYNIDVSGRAADYYSCSLNGIMDSSEEGQVTAVEVEHDLDDLYHGLVSEATFTTEPGEQVVTVPLTKDTNRIRVVLQHMSGEAISADKFSFKITADDAVLDYTNTVEPNHGVVYTPWRVEAASAAIGDDESDNAGVLNVVVAEMTVSRLVTTDSPRLTVTNTETGKVVFSIPIIDYALMVKGYENEQMTDQEYLDRQDEYNMTFFLDERDRWIDSYIYINSWKVVLQHSSLSME